MPPPRPRMVFREDEGEGEEDALPSPAAAEAEVMLEGEASQLVEALAVKATALVVGSCWVGVAF